MFCQNGLNFLRRLASQEKKLDGSSRLDFVEIARVPGVLLSLIPSWLGQGLISTPVLYNIMTAACVKKLCGTFVWPECVCVWRTHVLHCKLEAGCGCSGGIQGKIQKNNFNINFPSTARSTP